MSDLFGAEMPLAVRFFLAFLIVLGLIGVAAWAVRRFGAGRLGSTGLRGRQPRLSVIERTSVDARRWLYLVRRDNVEHLLLIGGPSDVVVEPNIVRASPATREVTVGRVPAVPETLPRAIPLPENGGNGAWPLQPEPGALSPAIASPPPPRRAPRVEPIIEEPASLAPAPHPAPHVEPAPRAQRDPLAALAEDLTTNPVVAPVAPIAPAAPAAPPLPPAAPRSRPAPAIRPHTSEPRAERRVEPRAELRPPISTATTEGATAADQSLADMAQRLELALRKPRAGDGREVQAAPARTPPAPEPQIEAEAAAEPPPPQPAPAAPAPPPRAARPAEARPLRADANPTDAKAKEGKVLYDTLEQEMASLLGRPAGKT